MRFSPFPKQKTRKHIASAAHANTLVGPGHAGH
jgi:hypothetical protein